ncbi:hypothetical protein HaLaN_29916 [Haematococcus lacustris]|uniref:Uncharacterized protein n=1 Tax=Haematococcus lacustris TaxID=44745 RepID=A0A6A0AE64_HAELA|nr:hypothetical protein HaLaN_29916 [Haematococcus lacustris]
MALARAALQRQEQKPAKGCSRQAAEQVDSLGHGGHRTA